MTNLHFLRIWDLVPSYLSVEGFWNVCVAIMSFCAQESQFWKLYKEDPSACAIVMRTAAGLVYLLACLLEPFMPSFSVEVMDVDCSLVLHYAWGKGHG